MRKFSIEVSADGRPITLACPTLSASNHGVAFRRAYQQAKAHVRRGTKVISVRATALGTEHAAFRADSNSCIIE